MTDEQRYSCGVFGLTHWQQWNLPWLITKSKFSFLDNTIKVLIEQIFETETSHFQKSNKKKQMKRIVQNVQNLFLGNFYKWSLLNVRKKFVLNYFVCWCPIFSKICGKFDTNTQNEQLKIRFSLILPNIAINVNSRKQRIFSNVLRFTNFYFILD